MTPRDALYDWLQGLIDDAADDTPLKDAVLFRNLRGSVETAQKIVRVDCYGGRRVPATDVQCKEQDVDAIVQFWYTLDLPGTGEVELEKLDAAKDASYEMFCVACDASKLSTGQTLAGRVDLVDGDEWENTEETLGTVLRAVTYWFVKINP
jgi:hypothetical protein